MNKTTKNKEQKYFYVFNRKEADTIHKMTNSRYYKFTNKDGEVKYSFLKSKDVLMAYRMYHCLN